MKIKEDCDHGSEDRESSLRMERERRSLQRDFGDLEVQMGVRDVTSPIAVLAITDFGTNWGERAWDRISGQRGTSFGK